MSDYALTMKIALKMKLITVYELGVLKSL